MKRLYSIFFFIACLDAASQTLRPTPTSAFSVLLDFNADLIRENKIKSITFDIIDKKDYEVAEDKGLMNYYEFNSGGQLTRFYYTTIVKTIQKEYHSGAVYKRRRLVSTGHVYYKNEYVYDTVSTIYIYNSDNNLILKRYNDGNYYESRYYNYDSRRRVTKEKRFKETNNSDTKSNFILGNQTLLSEDSFQYVDITPRQYKQICLNNENRPYKEIIVNTDSTGRIISTNENYTVAWIVQSAAFTYTNGLLMNAEFKGNANGDIILRNDYEYDANKCIYSEKQYKNNVLLKEISYVTDNSTKLLNSFISRDALNKTMRIIKLVYKY